MEELYSYYFHFNSHQGKEGMWNAVERTKSVEYLNGTLDKNDIIKHENINVIINYITKSATKK